MPTVHNPPDWVTLIPALKKGWSADTDWQFILGVSGSIELALLYGEMFWPTLIEYDGMVFSHREDIEKSAQHWMAHTQNDRLKVEKVLNHQHLFHIHEPGENVRELFSTPAQLRAFGEKLRQTWSAKLKSEFPDRRFEVALYGDPDQDMGDYQITFWQTREE
jgi:hypothetical protein